jgi:uncharacterized membrane protein
LKVLRICFALAYPFLVYVAVTRWSARGAGLVILACSLAALSTTLQADQRAHLKCALLPLLPALLLSCLTVLVDDERFLLATPVLANLALFAAFLASLWPGRVSMIERFARTVHAGRKDLDQARQEHCRQVTRVWCGVFLFNAVACALLGLYAPIGWWAAYTGFIAYLLMGSLIAAEWWLRRRRFPLRPESP